MKGDNAYFVNALRNFLGLAPLAYTKDSHRKLGTRPAPTEWDAWPSISTDGRVGVRKST